ncbi:hypothetical protein GW17_00022426 [Ensete ventricosum]|nr:hypothetical protein GW17_00022426 [Ensete ventricosum]
MEGNNGKDIEQKNKDDTGVAYTDVTISANDVMRARGLAARDDISSFLPVAIDSTDFVVLLRGAYDFEEPQGKERCLGQVLVGPNRSTKKRI